MIEELKGIQKEKEKVMQEKSKGEYLIDLENCLLDKTKRKKIDFSLEKEFLYDLYQMDPEEEEKIIEFNENDLIDYLWIASCGNNDLKTSEIKGIFSGYLLSLLTKRCREQGKSTRFYFNGNKMIFDRLFYKARNIDQVIINSFKGNNLCSPLGNDVQTDSLVLMNCETKWLNLGYGHRGKRGMLAYINCRSDNKMLSIPSFTNIDLILNVDSRIDLFNDSVSRRHIGAIASLEKDTRVFGPKSELAKHYIQRINLFLSLTPNEKEYNQDFANKIIDLYQEMKPKVFS